MVFLALMACILVGVAAYNLTCAFVDVPTSKTSKMMMFAKKQQGISVKSTTPFTEPPFQPTATVTICSPPHICRKRLLFSVWASGHRTSITQMNWTNF